jgi:hypothetical protein
MMQVYMMRPPSASSVSTETSVVQPIRLSTLSRHACGTSLPTNCVAPIAYYNKIAFLDREFVAIHYFVATS